MTLHDMRAVTGRQFAPVKAGVGTDLISEATALGSECLLNHDLPGHENSRAMLRRGSDGSGSRIGRARRERAMKTGVADPRRIGFCVGFGRAGRLGACEARP